METNITTVELSYQVVGSQLQPGVYHYSKKSKKLYTRKYPKEDICTINIKLSNEFCQYHMSKESRPNRNTNIKAYSRWMIMSPIDRLKWHTVKYAYDQGNIGKVVFEIT